MQREVVGIVGIVVKGGGKDKKYEEQLKFQIGLERNLEGIYKNKDINKVYLRYTNIQI